MTPGSGTGLVPTPREFPFRILVHVGQAGNPRLLREACRHVNQHGADIARQAYLLAGTRALRDGPIQRCFRDAFVATQHAMVAPRTFELAGRMRLGLETDTRQL